MLLGVDYYPEQWDPARMEADMDTIREMGGNTIRIAEFAWHRMEPTEGHYDFSFFDRVLAMAREKGLQVILGTPTATIPAWLANKHPNILSQFENGQPRAFGGRHVCCYNSPELYDYSEKIIRAMAGHYQNERLVVACQIDNEIGHEGISTGSTTFMAPPSGPRSTTTLTKFPCPPPPSPLTTPPSGWTGSGSEAKPSVVSWTSSPACFGS